MTTTTASVEEMVIEGAQRLFLLSSPLRFAVESGYSLPPAAPRLTIARHVNGTWRWRWQHGTYRGTLLVNGGLVVDGAAFVDGDRLRYQGEDGHTVEAVVRVSPARLLVASRKGALSSAAWNSAHNASASLYAGRVVGRWFVFAGPGARQRAIPVQGRVRRPLFVVAQKQVDDELTVDVLPDSRVVIEHRGICTLAEVLAASIAQEAFLDAPVAVDLCMRALARSEHQFSARGVEIDVDGAVNVMRGEASSHTAAEAGAALRILVCGRSDASPESVVSSLEHAEDRQALRRHLALAGDQSQRSFLAELGKLGLERPSPAAIGSVARALFADRVRAEAQLEEELAALDERSLQSLIQRALETQL